MSREKIKKEKSDKPEKKNQKTIKNLIKVIHPYKYEGHGFLTTRGLALSCPF
jgi:hypothetical protein